MARTFPLCKIDFLPLACSFARYSFDIYIYFFFWYFPSFTRKIWMFHGEEKFYLIIAGTVCLVLRLIEFSVWSLEYWTYYSHVNRTFVKNKNKKSSKFLSQKRHSKLAYPPLQKKPSTHYLLFLSGFSANTEKKK